MIIDPARTIILTRVSFVVTNVVTNFKLFIFIGVVLFVSIVLTFSYENNVYGHVGALLAF